MSEEGSSWRWRWRRVELESSGEAEQSGAKPVQLLVGVDRYK